MASLVVAQALAGANVSVPCCIPAAPRQQSRRLSVSPDWKWKLRVSATSDLVESEEDSAAASVRQEAAETNEASASSAVGAGTGDELTMMFKAEGSMPDASIPTLKQALEEMEKVKDVSIASFEGLTIVSLTKSTVIQATNVASELVEALEKGGFRMHTLNLAIDDDV